MKLLLFICSFIFASNCFAQEYTLPTDLVKTFLAEEYPTVSLDMLIETKLGADNFYETIIKYSNKSESFKLKPLTYPNFEVKLKQAITDVISSTEVNSEPLVARLPDPKVISQTVPKLFTRIVSFHNSEEARPQVANIYLRNQEIPIYYTHRDTATRQTIFVKRQTTFVNSLKKVKVELSFYGGFIEKIQVQGVTGSNNTPLTFNNIYSIGISSTKNIQQLNSYVLFSDEKYNVTSLSDLKISETDIQSSKTSNRSLHIKVGDVLRYVKKVDVNANDVSPVPQVLALDEQTNQSILYREETSRLFEAVVYTDFFGLFEEENPNGIVQTEVIKRFHLNTKLSDTRWYHNLLVLPLLSEGIGCLQYFDATFQYSKIESHNKYVVPKTFEMVNRIDTTMESINYYSLLNLFQQRNFSFGGDLNLFALENQNSKLNIYINSGFRFGRTGIKTSQVDSNGIFVNNLEIPMEVQFLILPEKRVSFSISNKLSWFETFDSNIELKSIKNDTITTKNNLINSINLGLNVDISTSGKLFLRYKLTHELDNINNNFARLQFGYSFYLLKDNGVKKKVR